MKIFLLMQRVSDTYSYDGTSLENRGVFTSFDNIRKALFSDHSGEIIDHVEPKGFNSGSFKVKYHNGATLSSFPTDKYEYDEIEIDKMF